jgi:uncharacterized membrane-anchored protein
MFNRLLNIPDYSRLIVLGAMTAIILTVINIEIASKERIVRDGTTVLLQLAPRDPRSLLQGDYMALRYSMAGAVARAAESAQVSDGRAVITLQENGEARFVRIDQGQALQQGEYLLQFRKRGESVRLASDAFFFEEGEWDTYSGARFGEVRVNRSGAAVLTGLRDGYGERLGAPLH